MPSQYQEATADSIYDEYEESQSGYASESVAGHEFGGGGGSVVAASESEDSRVGGLQLEFDSDRDAPSAGEDEGGSYQYQ